MAKRGAFEAVAADVAAARKAEYMLCLDWLR